MTQPAAGWFPDPSDPSRLRYFDGRAWTEQYANVGGTPPFPAQPTKPVKKPGNWKMLGVVGAAILFAVFLVNLGGTDDKKPTAKSSDSSYSKSYNTQSAPTRSSAPAVAPASAPPVAPAGSSVRDGKFEFQVLGVERGATSLDDAFGPEIAKGEFFTVKIRVTNVGDDSRSFSATNQKLMINGNEYEATSFMDNSWMEDINPGLGIDARVVFDIPKGAVPTAIECHDSMFSGGAQLAL